MTLEPWCRACGAAAERSDSWCGRCGISLEPPHPGEARIGQVISVKGKMLRRNGIALQEAGGTVRVLIKGDETVDMPAAEFDVARLVDVRGPRVGGAAGRLWRAQRACLAKVLDAKWDPEPVLEAAQLHATAATGTRRGAALDALALGVHDVLPGLGLTPGETAWYRARTAASAGDTAAMLGWLERLPAQGYKPRITLLIMRAADLLADPALGTRAAAQLFPFAAADLDARTLHAALAGPGMADLIAPLVAFAVAAEATDGRLAEWASAITATARPAVPFPDALPMASALDCYLRFRDGAECTAKVDVLRWLPVPLLDEMIDQGAVPRELAAQPGWAAGSRAYVMSRLAPEAASLDDLTAAGFTAELARRHYLSGDTAAIDALPADDEAVRHYRTLAAWGPEAGQPSLDGLRPGARQVLADVSAARAAVRAGEDPALTESVATDPTCWPLLWQSALQGALRLPGPMAGRYPRFAEWLALCGIQRLLFQSRWEDALAAGRALAARTGLETTSDEALNMVAFAQFQLGQPASALQTLDDALGGRYTTGLLVNASIVAASQGSEAALPYLVKITGEERDEAVRSGAVERAVELWQQDETSPAYPEMLRALVRAALTGPQPDELHKTLLVLTCGQDKEWLASSPALHSANPSQAAWERYQRSWARRKQDGSQEGLSDVAQMLADLVKSPSPPPWAAAELRKFVNDLDEAVHVNFGEPDAVLLTPTISVLLQADILELAYRIIFPIQAATHSAFFLSKEGSAITPWYEQLLFDTVRLYLQRQAELTDTEKKEYAASEVAKGVAAVSIVTADVLTKEKEAIAERYNVLVQQQRYADDYQRARLRLAKLQIVNDQYKPLRDRLGRYHVLLGQIPLDEAARKLRNDIGSVLAEWGSEINDLSG
jgi:hypothetical protein